MAPRRWNRTTASLPAYRFEACTPDHRSSSGHIFHFLFSFIYQYQSKYFHLNNYGAYFVTFIIPACKINFRYFFSKKMYFKIWYILTVYTLTLIYPQMCPWSFQSCDGRVVKARDQKSLGVSPRRFESCSQRFFFWKPSNSQLLTEIVFQ